MVAINVLTSGTKDFTIKDSDKVGDGEKHEYQFFYRNEKSATASLKAFLLATNVIKITVWENGLVIDQWFPEQYK
jgi:hypothetical protein